MAHTRAPLETIERAVEYIKGTDGTRDILPSEARRLSMAAYLLECAAAHLRGDAQVSTT